VGSAFKSASHRFFHPVHSGWIITFVNKKTLIKTQMNKKFKIWHLLFALLFLAPVIFWSCKKDAKTGIPVVTTSAVTDITQTTASGGGIVTDNGGGEIISCGICWSAGRVPTLNDKLSSTSGTTAGFTLSLNGMVKNTNYYVMAYATNSAGTGFGEPIMFRTQQGSGTVTDVDGNIYDTVQIGTQVWLVQNLKVTHYRNGEAIDNRTDNTQWCNFISGSYCDYGNDVNNVPEYGRLYNWYAVNDTRKIAPEGWHVATDADWLTLVNFLGGDAAAGGKLKESGTSHWESPNTGANNETGFAALPAGTRFGEYGIPGYGTFTKIGKTAEWWTSDEQRTWGVSYDAGAIVHNTDSRWTDGFSVRCVKGNL
jgi:uncharacterized protein (TIGR02145 family)